MRPETLPPVLPPVAVAPAAVDLAHDHNELVALRHLRTRAGGEFPESPLDATTLGFTFGSERPVTWTLGGQARPTRMREGDMVACGAV